MPMTTNSDSETVTVKLFCKTLMVFHGLQSELQDSIHDVKVNQPQKLKLIK